MRVNGQNQFTLFHNFTMKAFKFIYPVCLIALGACSLYVALNQEEHLVFLFSILSGFGISAGIFIVREELYSAFKWIRRKISSLLILLITMLGAVGCGQELPPDSIDAYIVQKDSFFQLDADSVHAIFVQESSGRIFYYRKNMSNGGTERYYLIDPEQIYQLEKMN